MNAYVIAVRDQAAKILGEGADLSYLTPEFIEEAITATAVEVASIGVQWVEEGNSITPIPGGYKWRAVCSLTEWRQWISGPITTERTVNCANNFPKYRIRG